MISDFKVFLAPPLRGLGGYKCIYLNSFYNSYFNFRF